MGRFYNLSQTPLQSQFVEQPLDFMQGQLQAKQVDYDKAKAELEGMGVTPNGLENLTDETGNPIAVGDYNRALEFANKFNTSLEGAARSLETTGDINSAYYDARKLNKEYTQANSKEGILGRNKLREEKYNKLYNELSKVKNLPNSYWRSLPYLNEIQKMQGEEGKDYIPNESVAFAEHIDPIEKVNKIMQGINPELWSMYASSDGDYIRTGKKYGIDGKKIQETFYNGFNADTELQGDINSRIEYEYYKNNNGEQNLDYEDYYNQRKPKIYNELLNNAMKFKQSMGDMGMTADSHGVARTEYNLNNPSLYIPGIVGANKVTGQTFTEWTNNLKTKRNEVAAKTDATNNIGYDLFSKLGITDPNVMKTLQANRTQLSNPDGSLNIGNFERLSGVKVTNNNIAEITNGLGAYNESFKQQNDLVREQNNIERRMDEVNSKFAKENKGFIDNNYNNYKDFYQEQGINSSEELMNRVFEARKTGEELFPGLREWAKVYGSDYGGAEAIIQMVEEDLLDKVSNKLDDYYTNNSTGNFYMTLDNSNKKAGVGLYNEAISNHFREDPTELFNLKVDGSGAQTIGDALPKLGIKLTNVDVAKTEIKMIVNPLNNGESGMMVTVFDKKGNKIKDIAVSDNGLLDPARDQSLNESYFNLHGTGRTVSSDTDVSNSNNLELGKGDLVAGKELRANEIYNMTDGQKTTIMTTKGTPYTITKIATGGYTLDSPGLSTKYNLVDENAIMQQIGKDTYIKDALKLQQ